MAHGRGQVPGRHPRRPARRHHPGLPVGRRTGRGRLPRHRRHAARPHPADGGGHVRHPEVACTARRWSPPPPRPAPTGVPAGPRPPPPSSGRSTCSRRRSASTRPRSGGATCSRPTSSRTPRRRAPLRLRRLRAGAGRARWPPPATTRCGPSSTAAARPASRCWASACRPTSRSPAPDGGLGVRLGRGPPPHDGTASSCLTGSSPARPGPRHRVRPCWPADRRASRWSASGPVTATPTSCPGAGAPGFPLAAARRVSRVPPRRRLVEEARRRAADLLEAAVDDIVLDRDRGVFHVAGTPSRAARWADLAAAGGRRALAAEADFKPSSATFPFGRARGRGRGRPETGQVAPAAAGGRGRRRHGRQPAAGGGPESTAGWPRVRPRRCSRSSRYDDDGNPLTSNFADYGVPLRGRAPSFECRRDATPTGQPARGQGHR